jgi:thioredoxin-related protein
MKLRNVLMITLLLFAVDSFAQKVEMITEWEKAKELASQENKDILVILTGSEWCKPCKKMDKYVIADPEFQKYAKENLVVFLVDLPGGGIIMNSPVNMSYEKFKRIYQTSALPSLILADRDGEKIRVLEGKLHQVENVLAQLRAALPQLNNAVTDRERNSR